MGCFHLKGRYYRQKKCSPNLISLFIPNILIFWKWNLITKCTLIWVMFLRLNPSFLYLIYFSLSSFQGTSVIAKTSSTLVIRRGEYVENLLPTTIDVFDWWLVILLLIALEIIRLLVIITWQFRRSAYLTCKYMELWWKSKGGSRGWCMLRYFIALIRYFIKYSITP